MKGKDQQGRNDFWSDKTPCWVMRGCISEACENCPAFSNRSLPCWEQDTLCKELLDVGTCFTCEVYLRYGPATEPGGAGSEWAGRA